MFDAASLPDMTSLLATIQKLYPQARVTSGYRGPDNPLTQAHPGSMHAQGSPTDPGAVDVAPIPGVNFNDYVNSIKQAGVPVAQAFDEQKHPFKWTTGPNWHLAQGQAPVQPYYQQKPRSLGDVRPDMSAMAQVDTGAPQQMTSLGDIAGMNPSLPKSKGYNGLFPGKDWKAILGILADGLTAYGGGQPVFGPALLQRQRDDRQQGFDREKWAAELTARKEAANQPPQFVQNLGAWLQMTPDQKHQYLMYQDASNPNTVAGPQGPQNLPRTATKTVNGKSYYNIGGEWYEEGQ